MRVEFGLIYLLTCTHTFVHTYKGCPFDAAFWECPPLLPTDILSPIDDDGDSNGGFEFMLVDAPELLVSLEGGCVRGFLGRVCVCMPT